MANFDQVASTLPIPYWWQLPFATALAKTKLLPIHCHLCGINKVQQSPINPIHGENHWFNRLQFLCKDCHNSLEWQCSQFQLALLTVNQQIRYIKGVASCFYQFPYQQIIRAFKNSHQLDKLPLLVHAIRQLDKPDGCHQGNSVIIPVPTTTQRLTQRGFDPVTLLVKYLSFHWQIPVFTGVIRKERQKQQGLTREQRLANTQNAFTFLDLPSVANVILFDDVATTGATLQALADSLVVAQADFMPNQPYRVYARAVLHG